jgi:phosphorylated CTD-interacting factor 1
MKRKRDFKYYTNYDDYDEEVDVAESYRQPFKKSTPTHNRQQHRPETERVEFDNKIVPNDKQAPLIRGAPIWNFDKKEYNVLCRGDENDPLYTLTQEAQTRKINLAYVSPKLEFERSKRVIQLRTLYEEDCRQYLFALEAPKESFNRWLFEQLSVPNTPESDPLFRQPDLATQSEVIRREIFAEIPGRTRSRFVLQARKSLQNYCFSGRSWLQKVRESDKTGELINYSREEFIDVQNELSKAEAWLRNQPQHLTDSDLPRFQEQLDRVNKVSSAFFEKVLRNRVDQICSRLSANANRVISELTTMKQQLMEKGNPPEDIRVTFNEGDGSCVVSYTGNDRFEINLSHYNKLRRLYEIHNQAHDPQLDKFTQCLYVLLRRYQTFFGPNELEGGNFHAALPGEGFNYLEKTMEVCHECFASPLNCFFRNFCSAFPDTDRFFGSRGSFFDFKPIEGSFECGPPYTSEVMDKTAHHCLSLLKATDRPLSFIVFVPEWTDTEYGKILHPNNCEYCVFDFLAEQMQHKYVTGLQHLRSNTREGTNSRYWTLPFPTHVYYLQNAAARSKYPVTIDMVNELKKIMQNE